MWWLQNRDPAGLPALRETPQAVLWDDDTTVDDDPKSMAPRDQLPVGIDTTMGCLGEIYTARRALPSAP
jgi:hypothetical protein